MNSASAATASISPAWLLYGANGYTGELIAREAVQRGLKPILAGRHAGKINALAKELGCEARVFSLDNQTATVIALQDVAAVLNCAGPFSATAGRMMQACLVSHVHYLDITGEIEVFELAHSLDEKAQRARVLLCPGVGFDVVPTDCVAAKLKAALPDATHLALAFEGRGRPSVGTAKTGIEALRSGGCVRKDGVLTPEALAQRIRRIDLGEGEREAVSIPWGDVSTAYYTTGIPNIEAYAAGPTGSALRLQKAWRWRKALRTGFAQWLLKRAVARGPQGPNEAERNNNPTFVWGEAINAAGIKKTAHLHTANGYAVTVYSALGVLQHVLANTPTAGFTTPARLMGPDFIETLPGSSKIKIE
jgi:short subunit dehydrogenase-like uncharacterized protein